MTLAAQTSQQIRDLSQGEKPPRTAGWRRPAVHVPSNQQGQCRLSSEQNCTAL